jgi:hypothetical protein
LAAALPLLIVPGYWEVFARLVIQLAGLVLLGLVVIARLPGFTAATWYGWTGWSDRANAWRGMGRWS